MIFIKGHLVDLSELAMRMLAGELVCAGCACSDNNACDEGCSWIEPNPKIQGTTVHLCSSCGDLADKKQRGGGR